VRRARVVCQELRQGSRGGEAWMAALQRVLPEREDRRMVYLCLLNSKVLEWVSTCARRLVL
jgi:hypothetical protein